MGKYIVLKKYDNGPGLWEMLDTVEASSPLAAIRAARPKPEVGDQYAAIAESRFHVLSYAIEQRPVMRWSEPENGEEQIEGQTTLDEAA